ncbi:MAG: hypothetical protein WCX65_12720, partial [bacterium]
MSSKKIIPIFILLIWGFVSAIARAGDPQKINYQGYVKQGGVPVNASVSMTFKLFDAASGGAQLCAETATVPVSYGRFNYLIGTGCSISGINWQNPVYLEITIGASTLTPREQIVSGVYSLSKDNGTPFPTFTLDQDNTAAGVEQSLAFNRGSSSANDAMLTWDEANDRFLLLMQPGVYAALSLGIASATTYYGDGSNLTGVVASGAVAKTGDTMTGQLTSTVAIGTAPFVITSTTKVANLNVEQIDGYDAGNATGNIPINNGTVNVNLNADYLDGWSSTAFATTAHTHTGYVAK